MKTTTNGFIPFIQIDEWLYTGWQSFVKSGFANEWLFVDLQE